MRPNDGTTTTGTVHAPAGATGRPGVVLVHGSGDGRSAHYDLTADAFARAGIVALSYGKRTEGYTPAHRDYSLLADDALAGLAALRSRPEVDPARVGLWGLSEGGWVAPLAASRSADAACLITIGANSGPPAAQHGGQPTTDGFDKLPGLAPGYGELLGEWVNELPRSASVPRVDQPAVQGHPVRALEAVAWWESAPANLLLLAVIALAFGGYALTGTVRAWQLPDRRPARILISTAVIGIVGAVIQLGYILTSRATTFGPLLFGRTLPWLALQIVAVCAVVALGYLVMRTPRSPAGMSKGAWTRWAVSVIGGAGFVCWAIY
ncbi:hypothetical protein AB0H42_03130 [Nocardia sp. NPDC050799]|uniref:alpha/beta hydrolase family protein n=1 Tax=Nocardia sp. NPDC050799 TaxID=3154842 RepID=UPI0033E675E6